MHNMDSDILVVNKAMRESGNALLRALKRDYPARLVGLFWGGFDTDGFRLYLAMHLENGFGPRAVYEYLRGLTDVFVTADEAEESETFALAVGMVVVIGARESRVVWARRWAAARYGTDSIDDGVPGDGKPKIVRRNTLSLDDYYIYYLAPEK